MNIVCPKNMNEKIEQMFRYLKYPDTIASEGIISRIKGATDNSVIEFTIVAPTPSGSVPYTLFYDEAIDEAYWDGFPSMVYTPFGPKKMAKTEEIAIEEPADVEPIKPKKWRKKSAEQSLNVGFDEVKAEGTE